MDHLKNSNSTNSFERHFDMRAPPRRRIKEKDAASESENLPIFLRKAYAMISSCPPDIGGWSLAGDTVIIKDVKRFEEQIIPTVYKHNNFSSFVRQLNFYGFRKVKSAEFIEQHSSTWWEFRHPNFIRGQPHLLGEIKRAMHYASTEGNNSSEVQELKNQVSSLTDHISRLQDQITELSDIVAILQKRDNERYQLETSCSDHDNDHKKRKVGILPDGTEKTSLDGYSSGADGDGDQSVASANLLRNILEELDRPVSNLENSEDFDLDSIFDEWRSAGSESPVKAQPQRFDPNFNLDSSSSTGQGKLDLTKMMENLTPDLRARFIDRLAEHLGRQISSSASSSNSNIGFDNSSLAYRAALPSSLIPPLEPSSSKFIGGHPSRGFPVQERTLYTSGGALRSGLSSKQSPQPIKTFHQMQQELQQQEQPVIPDIALTLGSAALGAFMMSSLGMADLPASYSPTTSESDSNERDGSGRFARQADYQ